MLVVTGAIAYDHILRYDGLFKDHIFPEKLHMINISVVTETFTTMYGGTGANQAYTLGLLGMKPVLFGSAGVDFPEFDQHVRSAGVDTSRVHRDELLPCASGFALCDRSNNQIWGFAKNAMGKAKEMSLSTFTAPIDFVLITPDDFDAVINHVSYCIDHQIPYAFDPSFDIPSLTPEFLRVGVEHARILFGNGYEIAQLQERAAIDHQSLVKDKIVVTTFAEHGSKIEQGDRVVEIPIVPTSKIIDPAGAGDAYRSGFIAGYLRGFDIQTSGNMGALAATYAIEHNGAEDHYFSRAEFSQRYKDTFGGQILL